MTMETTEDETTADETTDDVRPVEIHPDTAKVLRGNMLLFRGQVGASGKEKIDLVVQDLTEALALAGHLGEEQVGSDDPLSVPELFAALRDGIDAFEEYLSSHGVEHRRVNVGPPHDDLGVVAEPGVEAFLIARDGVRFAVDDEHWTAEFHDSGNFKQLAWT